MKIVRWGSFILALVLIIASILTFPINYTDAEIAFTEIYPGTKGSTVENLQIRLSELGYYSGRVTGRYDTATQRAVEAFQTAAGIEADSRATVETQELLFSEDAPAPNPFPTPEPTKTPRPTSPSIALSARTQDTERTETYVWLSATGSKYHSKNNCGNMNPSKATKVSLEAAKQRYEPCKNCKPPK